MNHLSDRLALTYSPKKYKKIDIAYSLLKTACFLYKQKDYLAVINLAGASEEILGKYLKRMGKKNSLESMKEGFIKVSKFYNRNITDKKAGDFLNRVKNASKHYNEQDDNDKYVEMDIKVDSEDLLIRGLTNLWRLEKELSPLMDEVWKSIEG